MTVNEYQEAALATAVYPKQFRVIYPALGMNGEAGEVADKVKKVIRDTVLLADDCGDIVLPHDKRIELAKEIGDVLWYCATLSYDLGMKLEDVAQMNINKLKSRQERGKLSGSGDNR